MSRELKEMGVRRRTGDVMNNDWLTILWINMQVFDDLFGGLK